MRIYMAGGSPIVETTLKNPSVLLTFLTDVKDGKPNSRMEILLGIRAESKAKKKKGRK